MTSSHSAEWKKWREHRGESPQEAGCENQKFLHLISIFILFLPPLVRVFLNSGPTKHSKQGLLYKYRPLSRWLRCSRRVQWAFTGVRGGGSRRLQGAEAGSFRGCRARGGEVPLEDEDRAEPGGRRPRRGVGVTSHAGVHGDLVPRFPLLLV